MYNPIQLVEKTDTCWIWKGSTTQRGYGKFYDSDSKTHKYAHRYFYTQEKGDIPTGMVLCHSCDNPSCVNPNHLFIGTQSDNLRDQVNKGRHWSQVDPNKVKRGKDHWVSKNPDAIRADGNPNSKLTWDSVREMRRLYEGGGYTIRKLSEQFGVAWQTASDIVKYDSWKE